MKPEDLRTASEYIEAIKKIILDGPGRLKGTLYLDEEDIISPQGEGRWMYHIRHGNINRDILNTVRAAFSDLLIIDHSMTAEPFVVPWEGFLIYTTAGAALHRKTGSPRDNLAFYEATIPLNPPPMRHYRVPTHAINLDAFRGSIPRPW